MPYLLRPIAGLLSAIVCLHLGAGPAAAEKRVALVIGNSAYQHTRALPNPRNDAEAIARLLGDNGFAEVTLRTDLDYRALREAVRRFADAALAADVALVYFAGHGLEVAGENYLVPVDARLLRDVDLEYEAVTLGSLLGAVDGARRLKLVILDACRNNPLGEKMALRAGRMRSVTRGLARLEATGEVLVAYAAKAGTLAHDGTGRHSPYAEALLKHMAAPGLDVLRMFGRVKEAVLATTSRGQEPWIYGSPGGDAVALVPAKAGAAEAKPPAVAPQPTEVERAWAAVKESTSTAVLEAFRQQYGAANAVYDRLAAERIEELKRQQVAMLQAEEDRRRAQEERRRAEEEKKRADADLQPGRSFRDCPDCPEMVVVPGGSFLMGSPESESGRQADEGPQRRVTIARPFAAGKYEVTFAEWDACVAAGGCKHNPHDGWIGKTGWGRGNRPVINVSRNDITKEYLPWLARKTGKTYRLLTEAEWEYAARGVTTASAPAKRYWWGDTASHEYANYGKDKCCDGFTLGRDQWLNTAPVGQFPANPFGLHDMHGNVREWVHDCYKESYTVAASDGSAWTSENCGVRVLRGSSWDADPQFLRSARRYRPSADLRDVGNGFRLARTF